MSGRIIFSGPSGAGKTSAIDAASDIPAVWKGNADYGAMTLDDGGVIHLCSSVCEIATGVGADDSLGLILLIDNRRTAPDDDLLRHLRSFDTFIRRTAVAVGITHMDQQPRPRIDLFHTVMSYAGHGSMPLFEVDARDRRDVCMLVEAMVSVLDPVACA